MAGPIPTKKIPQLTAYGAALQGVEQLEIWATNASRRITARDFVLPLDSVLTLTPLGVVGSNSRQLIEGVGIVFVDGGPGGTVSVNATGAVAGPANPTAQVGLAPVNGAVLTYMRSDAAPALDQGIAPTWTGAHNWNSSAAFHQIGNSVLASSTLPEVAWNETDAAADNRAWSIRAESEQFMFGVRTDVGVFAPYMTADRTGQTVDSVNFTSVLLQINGVSVRDATNLFTSGTVPAARLPSSFSGLANPTGTIGLVAVNGVATTALRSDAAPPLSQAIAPTWTAQHIFSLSGATDAAVLVSSAQPQIDWNETDAAANNRRWRVEANGEQLLFRLVNDANSAAVTWMLIDRTANVCDLVALTSTALTWNGSALLSTATAFANPSASVGLAAVNGVATTAMRSDAAPALSQSITPTWTAAHTFTQVATGSTVAVLLSSNSPVLAWNEADAAANNRRWDIAVDGEQMLFRLVNDAVNAAASWMVVDRSANTVDSVTFPGYVFFTQLGATLNPAVRISSAFPNLEFNETDAASNAKNWHITVNGAQMLFRAVDDARTGANEFMSVARSGSTITSVSFPTGTSAAFLVGTSSSLVGNVTAQILAPAVTSALALIVPTSSAAVLDLWNQATTSDNVFMLFGTEGSFTQRGSITYNRGGGLVAYNTTSDARRKKNIRNSPENSGDLIDALKIRQFDWGDSEVHLDYWPIAQEWFEVFPLAVSEGDDTRDWAVDPSKVVPLMIKEIQSLRGRLKSLETAPRR